MPILATTAATGQAFSARIRIGRINEGTPDTASATARVDDSRIRGQYDFFDFEHQHELNPSESND